MEAIGMTIASRIRNEKRNAIDFRVSDFLAIVEKRFNEISYRSTIHLCTGKQDNIHTSFSDNTQCFDTIYVPEPYFDDAIEWLKREGFFTYRRKENENDVKIALFESPFVDAGGGHIYYRI